MGKVVPFSSENNESKKVDTFSDEEDERADEELNPDTSKYVGRSNKVKDTIEQKSEETSRNPDENFG
jgi:hypothetical protein